MNQKLIRHIADKLNISIKNYRSVTGGDISRAFLLETSHEKFFIKINQTPQAYQMFQIEKQALETIQKTKTIATPNVILCGKVDTDAFLLLEFIETKRPNSKELALLGKQIAELHLTTSDYFGWDAHNFIGSLPQSNKKHTNWTSFYLKERIFPQLEMAHQQGLISKQEIPNYHHAETRCESFFDQVQPALLHGDLWSGNFLIRADGTPFLIDPALYFGHSMMDIAMSKLFGGFGDSFYSAYHQIIRPEPQASQLVDLYQLYYLLVHLNLFGRSYYASCQTILQAYF